MEIYLEAWWNGTLQSHDLWLFGWPVYCWIRIFKTIGFIAGSFIFIERIVTKARLARFVKAVKDNRFSLPTPLDNLISWFIESLGTLLFFGLYAISFLAWIAIIIRMFQGGELTILRFIISAIYAATAPVLLLFCMAMTITMISILTMPIWYPLLFVLAVISNILIWALERKRIAATLDWTAWFLIFIAFIGDFMLSS